MRLGPGARHHHRSRPHTCPGPKAPRGDPGQVSGLRDTGMSLLVVGSVAFDALETPFGKVARALVREATYCSVAASFFTRVNLVGVVGDDFTEKDASIFRGRHIDLTGLERARGKTFFWAGRYTDNLNDRVTLATELNVFATFNPKLPPAYRHSPYIFLANIDPKLQRSVLSQVSRRPKLVALDTMNYWIERTPAELRKTLRHTQVLMINDAETRQLSSQHNLLRAAKHIFKLGPRTLVIKRGEQDRKSTRLNSSHANSSYAVFCSKKKTRTPRLARTR